MELITDRLAALAHPQRLSLFRLLVRRCPDELPAGEIAGALDLKPSTASAHLAALSRARLIRQNRVGTSLRYSLDTDGAQGLVADLFTDCCRGRPDLCPPALAATLAQARAAHGKKLNVLFICTGNSARSIIAEAILRDIASDRFVAHSAGTQPYSELNPMAVDLLNAKGLDTSGLWSKTTAEYQTEDAPQMDFVFTVCDLAANEDCPPWPGQPISAHWGLPDPVKATGTEAERQLAFQQTFGAMRNRIAAFANLPLATLDRASLQHHIDTIGRKDHTQ